MSQYLKVQCKKGVSNFKVPRNNYSRLLVSAHFSCFLDLQKPDSITPKKSHHTQKHFKNLAVFPNNHQSTCGSFEIVYLHLVFESSCCVILL